MMEWISGKERLPKEGEEVLFTDGRETFMGQYSKLVNIYGNICGYGGKDCSCTPDEHQERFTAPCGDFSNAYEVGKISYWMPLPEPPQDNPD